jgi:hydrogenase nickel incorporation protein HypA/HybF
MHELSIAMSIAEIACDEAGRQGNPRVEAVHLRLGADAGVVQDALLFSWPLVCSGTKVEGAELVVEQAAGRDLMVTGIVVLTENDAASG